MFANDPEEQREVWDWFYRDAPGRASDDGWLERWTDVLEANRDLPVLELGCGAGQDSRFLSERGLEVVATDLSEEALRLTRMSAPGVETKVADLGRPLPFPDASFGVVVASLSLHYFSWRQTEGVAAEIRRVLAPGGYLLARFNSKGDEFHDLAESEEIEEDFYLIKGLSRRFFDREGLEALFGEGWKLESAGERTTGRFGGAKTLWEVSVRRDS